MTLASAHARARDESESETPPRLTPVLPPERDPRVRAAVIRAVHRELSSFHSRVWTELTEDLLHGPAPAPRVHIPASVSGPTADAVSFFLRATLIVLVHSPYDDGHRAGISPEHRDVRVWEIGPGAWAVARARRRAAAESRERRKR